MEVVPVFSVPICRYRVVMRVPAGSIFVEAATYQQSAWAGTTPGNAADAAIYEPLDSIPPPLYMPGLKDIQRTGAKSTHALRHRTRFHLHWHAESRHWLAL